MRIAARGKLLAVVCMLVLNGCGGGGGGPQQTSTSNTVSTSSSSDSGCQTNGTTCPLTLTPAALQDQFEEGSATAEDVNFSSTLTRSPAAIRVLDPTGIFNPVITLSWYSSTSGVAHLQSLATAKPGHYKSALSIQLCSDATCNSQIPGSPISLPYDIVVQSTSPNLTPLSQVTSDWVGFQANAAHSGAINLTVDPTKFSHRWHWVPEASSGVTNTSPVVTSGGTVFFSTNFGRSGLSSSSGYWLIALDEATGQQKWMHDFGASSGTIPPAIQDGVVYAGSKAGGGGWDVYSGLNATNGSEVWSRSVPTQWRYPRSTVFAGGRLLQHGGYNNGGVVGLGLTDAQPDWFADIWADATYPGAITTDGNFAYTLAHDNTVAAEGYLAVVDVQTGEQTKHIRPTWPAGTHPFASIAYQSGEPTPILTGPNRILLAYSFKQNVSEFHLELIDTSTSTDVWHLDIPFASSMTCMYSDQCNLEPVAANGVFYVLNPASQALEARSLSDGSELWSWRPDDQDRSPIFGSTRPSIIATSNMIFVSTARFVYAVSTVTNTSQWRYPSSGQLAISGNGVLYISRPNGRVDAVNLR